MTNHSPELIEARLMLDQANIDVQVAFNVAVKCATEDLDACRQANDIPNNWMLASTARAMLYKYAKAQKGAHTKWMEEQEKSKDWCQITP